MKAPRDDGKGNFVRTRRQASTAVLEYSNYINFFGVDAVIKLHGVEREVIAGLMAQPSSKKLVDSEKTIERDAAFA